MRPDGVTPVAVPASELSNPRRLWPAERVLYGNRWQAFDPPRALKPKPKPAKPGRDPRVAAALLGVAPEALDAVPSIPTEGEDMPKKVLKAAPANPVNPFAQEKVSYREAEAFHNARGAVSQLSFDTQGRLLAGPGGVAVPAAGPGQFDLGANRAVPLKAQAQREIDQAQKARR